MNKFIGFLKKAANIAKKATNIAPVLEMLRTGILVKVSLMVLHLGVTVLTGVFMLFIWGFAWSFIVKLSFFGGVALLFWQIAFLYAAILAIKSMILRAHKILLDYPDSDYLVTPVVVMHIKAFGEMIFIFFGVMSVPSMLLVWFAGRALVDQVSLLVGFNILTTFSGPFGLGFGICVALVSAGMLAILLTQIIAEWILVLFSIGYDINLLRRNFVSIDLPSVALTSDESEK
ncbi:MAG: hypothetical protein GX811_02705 [Lentisphaerae bacterium]|nr:hypothetical protein [Lentisphaerota bacterium]